MIKLMRYCKTFLLIIILMLVSLLAQAMCDLALPDYMSKIVDIGIRQGDIPYVVSTSAIMLMLALAGMAATIITALLSARFAAGFSRDVRHDIFRKVESFSLAECDKFSTASLITRTTNDVQQIQFLLVMLPRVVFYSPILAVGAVFKVLATDSGMSWIIAVGIVAVLIIVTVLFSIAVSKFKIVQKLTDKLNLITRQILTGLPVIRSFGTHQYEEEKFDRVNTDFTKINLTINRLMVFMMPSMMFIMNLMTLLIVWFGAGRIDAGAMQVGNMIALITYTMQIIMSFLMITMISLMLPRASVSGKRIAEVLDSRTSVCDPEISVDFEQNKKGTVEFRNVSFRYHDAEEDTLKNISFIAKPGKTTAFIGSTGSGKSTLGNLLLRFYDVSEGSVLVNGVDIRLIKQGELRSIIGYVPQKATLFSGTIDSNLRYGKQDADMNALIKASQTAQAIDFIKEKPEGFDSRIAQDGANVSGGQKQRLSIARALVKQPQIYIFDDCFSALDFKTDAALRKALLAEAKESTLLLVAQRVSAIKNADQIIVIEKGQIAGCGRHEELLESCEVYREIALSQLSKEELAS